MTQLRPASVGLRAVSWAVDLLVVAASGGITWWLTHSWGAALVVAAEVSVVLWFFVATTGRTLGTLATNIVVHAANTNRAPGFRLRGIQVTDLRPVLQPAVTRDAYGRETASGEAFAPIPQPQVVQSSAAASAPPSSETIQPNVAPKLWLDADGQRVELASTVVIGRAPAIMPDGKEVPFEIEDLSRSLSRNHAKVSVGPEGIWVEDAGSANGTGIRSRNGQMRVLAHGERARVELDDELLLGDRVVRIVSA